MIRISLAMDIRSLTPDYAVSPQISPEDMAAIRAAGFHTLICNRPDAEVPPDLSAAVMRRAAEEAGLVFVENPMGPPGLTQDMVERQARALAEAAGPVLAYCASGTRSVLVWMVGAAPQTPADQLVDAAERAGYPLRGHTPALAALYRG